MEQFQQNASSPRDKGTDFEHLMIRYLQNEPFYQDQYQNVQTYADWVATHQRAANKQDSGIDLVATTASGEFHAIQCKNYSADYSVQKSDIDSFFTASGKKDFSHRIIITTTDKWSPHAAEALDNQHIPVSTIKRSDLENSAIDWLQYLQKQQIVLKDKKQLRPHQSQALNAVLNRFQTAERGKLIMACGTGKTFTALKIAEEQAGAGKMVLFLVPSLALLSQTLTEWTQESAIKLHNFAVCSDSEVGKKKSDEDESNIISRLSDLQYPATTNAASLTKHINALKALNDKKNSEAMTVVYSTYHSIDVIHQAQQMGLGEFDLIICDEAHRTTGHTYEGESDSNFVKVHNNDFIRAQKRLYMTATPRIYGSDAKKQAKDDDGSVVLYSMDNRDHFGDTFYTISFSEAVKQGLLVDYKVIVLTVAEAEINRRLEKFLSNGEIHVDDAAKIIGCWKALSKQGLSQDLNDDFTPMKRAVAFCQVIEKNFKGKKHKVSSKAISEMFSAVVEAYQASETDEDLKQQPSYALHCDAEHVDGSMNALEKQSKINWLKADTPENTCRILSNVRCLSEGVDVPALDAVLFLTPRNSEVDVVQSVGRVMRRAEGKKRGYVILPVVITAGVEPDKALDNNENYRVVWQVLNALRSHDDRFEAMLNQMQFDGSNDKIEIVAAVKTLQCKNKTTAKQKNRKQSATKQQYRAKRRFIRSTRRFV
ncbi:restriction endonuclease [Neisseria perflava]|uniref:restriction endonuclease n=1 Tax=Neisseria perflava TaxID=33053 RepID=UPI002646825E|nr:DEAD/DEAH box helicase family protein [Neisseria perflava]